MIEKKLGLVGENISYSLSPRLHALLLHHFGINDATYQLIDIKKEQFDVEIKKVKQEFYGFNVTKPYKNLILPYVDSNFSEVGSVNTCICAEQTKGYNTDVGGFLKSFSNFLGGYNGTALILGAGGAAASVACSLKKLNITAYIYNRTFEKAQELAKKFALTAITQNDTIKPQIIINCTTLGLGQEQALPDFVDISRLKYAFDTIYNPPLTPFLNKAKECGANIKNGFGMLVYQAILTENILFDLHLTDEEQEQAYKFACENF